MPVPFPTLNPETGELVPTDYYTVGEVAALLHVSHTTVRRRILANEWPHLTIAQAHYMSAEHVARVVAMHTVAPEPAVGPDDPPPPKLGTPLSDRDLEGIR
jgi:AraC-like DNA-binding protein